MIPPELHTQMLLRLPIATVLGSLNAALPRAGTRQSSSSHGGRTDYSMLLGVIFLLCVGAGPWSLDTWLGSREEK